MFAWDPYALFFSFAVIVALHVVTFSIAVVLRTDILTDITYGVAFIVAAVAVGVGEEAFDLRSLALMIAVFFWGARLGGYLLVRIIRMGKDDRFDGIREAPLKFLAFWVFQVAIVWITLLPVTVGLALAESNGFEWMWTDVLGLSLFASGFIIEWVADQQKFAFKNNAANRGNFIQSGLWRYSRHPNYFGESLIWIGLTVVAFPLLSGYLYLALLSPLVLTGILLFVSGVPILEKNAEEKYGDAYRRYKAVTSVFVPWLPGRSQS